MSDVLLIEDDKDLLELMKDALENAGFNAITAINGNEGIKLFSEQPCRIVVTDLLMPGKEGYETILALKQILPAVRIVAISGGGNTGRGEDLLRHAKAFGAHLTMSKPIVMKDLVEMVGQLTAG
ncbi:MAG: response regulator [Clostridia bacterium]|nr:response regulator [Spirochaetia bacterium]